MAFLLQNLSPHLFMQSTKSSNKENPVRLTISSSLSSPSHSIQVHNLSSVSSPPPLLEPPVIRGVHVKEPPSAQDCHKDEFYVNLGLAVRSLRDDLSQLFVKELNYDVYRDDITFIDPLNTFTGLDKYKLIFWALRFHGRVLFKDIDLQIVRIWQPSENMIVIRWNLKGTPRVPWEAKGEFQGTSRYKLDRKGKIYEHKVDNLAFNFPRQLKPLSVLDLVTASARPVSPNLSFLWNPQETYSCSWIELYRTVRVTLDQPGNLLAQDGFVTC